MIRPAGEFARVLKKAMRAATGRAWSVTSGHGTAREIVHLSAPRTQRATAPPGTLMTLEDRTEIARIFGLANPWPGWAGMSISPSEQLDALGKVIEAILVRHPEWTREQLAREEFPS